MMKFDMKNRRQVVVLTTSLYRMHDNVLVKMRVNVKLGKSDFDFNKVVESYGVCAARKLAEEYSRIGKNKLREGMLEQEYEMHHPCFFHKEGDDYGVESETANFKAYDIEIGLRILRRDQGWFLDDIDFDGILYTALEESLKEYNEKKENE